VNIIGGYYGAEDEARAEVEEWVAMGFRGCKFKLGSRPPRSTRLASRRVGRPSATTS
jgi:L-alanine-DL-glutamate epimerase-like enolase superfamily enzyme